MLQIIGSSIREHLRSSDCAARCGGDEFCVFLPETDGVSAAAAGRQIQERLNDKMQDNGWGVTISIGIATFSYPPLNTDEVVRRSAALMLDVKKVGKNAIKHCVYGDEN